jgi:hypothetical protein
MTEPLVFISHKHSDSEIAKIIGDFIEQRSNNKVRVHLSSSPDFTGPKFYGPNLNAQLRTTLWGTDVLLLIYTSEEEDWSYCMWECGVATLPVIGEKKRDTNIVVFQCGRDVPPPFKDVLRVDVRNPKDIESFIDQFLRGADFFPSRDKALAPQFKDQFLKQAALDLHKSIGKELPDPDPRPDEWAAWPFLRIELPRAEADQLVQSSGTAVERARLAHELVRDHAVVVNSSARAAQLFGQESIGKDSKFAELLKTWKAKYPDADATWFDSCCEQIMMGAGRGFPVIRLTPMREYGGNAEYTPVLSRIRQVPFRRRVQFDLYFYNLSDPRAMLVTSRMIRFGDFLYKDLGQVTPESLKLMALRKELDARGLNRVPVFDALRHPLYIIHRSMIEQFILNQFEREVSPHDLTLADLLADPDMRQMFENTFVVVKQTATLAEARDAMSVRQGCNDVFVTAHGNRDEPVVGWLTNVDIVRGS